MVSLSRFFVFMSPPLLGSFFMGWTCGLVGFLSYFLESSLFAEVLSHTAYPGILIGLWIFWILEGTIDIFSWKRMLLLSFWVACVVSFFLEGYRAFYRKRVSEDAILCWSLSTAMGLSSLLVSCFQTKWFCLLPFAQKFLYGQAVFMEWDHVTTLATLACMLTLGFLLFRHQIKFFLFNPDFTIFPPLHRKIFFILMRFVFTLATLAGLQTGGIFVVTSLMVTPAVTAQIALNNFFHMAFFSALLGSASALIGLFLSLVLDLELGISLPPGPVIVFVSIFLFAMFQLFAWPKGWLARTIKRKAYERKCFREILLKTCLKQEEKLISAERLSPLLGLHELKIEKGLSLLFKEGFLERCSENTFYLLTEEGKKEAMCMLRLHRLWELYLVKMGGVSLQDVHHYAEEMEHALASESSEILYHLLGKPKQDPHGQKIPSLQD